MVSLCSLKTNKVKGSLSIEASICIWIMLCFSIVIFTILKIASIDLLLHDLAADTVSEIAANSRIIAIADSIENEGSIVAGFEGFTENISRIAGEFIVDKIWTQNLKHSKIPNWGNARVLWSHLPCFGYGQNHKENNTDLKEIYEKYGYSPDIEDVALIIEYSIVLHMPFLGERIISLRHMAVERAWVKGEVDMFSLLRRPASIEPDPGENRDFIVYITKTGTRYHEFGCRYLAKSSIPIKLGKAVSRGYIKCLICGGGIPLEKIQ